MRLTDELGKRRMLTIVKKVDFGVYLGTKEERVLLPKKEVPAGAEAGDPVRYSCIRTPTTASSLRPPYPGLPSESLRF